MIPGRIGRFPDGSDEGEKGKLRNARDFWERRSIAGGQKWSVDIHFGAPAIHSRIEKLERVHVKKKIGQYHDTEQTYYFIPMRMMNKVPLISRL